MKFMLRVKPSSRHKETTYQAIHGERWHQGVYKPDHRYRLLSQQLLNRQHPDVTVKVMQECDAKGKLSEWTRNWELSA